MFKLSELLTKFDAMTTFIIFVICIWFLIRTRKIKKDIIVKIFSTFILYISIVQAIMSFMAYSGHQNLYLIKYFISIEFGILSFLTLKSFNSENRQPVIISLLFTFISVLISILMKEDFPFTTYIFNYSILLALFVASLFVTKVKYGPVFNELIKGFMFYCISGLILAFLYRLKLYEAFCISSILKIYANILFGLCLIKIKEVL